MRPTPGPVRFSRYAYPPNELGYCGPDQSRELLERTAAGLADPDLRRLAAGFEGAWPYLTLIAAANGIADPLDAGVVEAYWLGNALLDAVPLALLFDSLDSRFGRRDRRAWVGLRDGMSAQARPQHGFHVFCVYPWMGLLRGGVVAEPLHVLDRCRIRWGQVVEVSPTTALVRSRALTWDGHRLALGGSHVEQVRHTDDGATLAPGLAVGQWCSMHWDWVCEPLDGAALSALRHQTVRHLAVANAPNSAAAVAVLR